MTVLLEMLLNLNSLLEYLTAIYLRLRVFQFLCQETSLKCYDYFWLISLKIINVLLCKWCDHGCTSHSLGSRSVLCQQNYVLLYSQVIYMLIRTCVLVYSYHWIDAYYFSQFISNQFSTSCQVTCTVIIT